MAIATRVTRCDMWYLSIILSLWNIPRIRSLARGSFGAGHDTLAAVQGMLGFDPNMAGRKRLRC